MCIYIYIHHISIISSIDLQESYHPSIFPKFHPYRISQSSPPPARGTCRRPNVSRPLRSSSWSSCPDLSASKASKWGVRGASQASKASKVAGSWCPPSYQWIYKPINNGNISPRNHSYWTYKPTWLTIGHHLVGGNTGLSEAMKTRSTRAPLQNG